MPTEDTLRCSIQSMYNLLWHEKSHDNLNNNRILSELGDITKMLGDTIVGFL